MITAAIDIGGRQLRAAYSESGTIKMVPLPSTSLARFCSVEAIASPHSVNGTRFRISALKRNLDFERSLKLPSGENRTTIDILAEVLVEAGKLIAPSRGDQDIKCVLTVSPLLSQRERAAYIEAAAEAGLHKVKLVDDTLAACLGSSIAPSRNADTLVISWGATAFCCLIYRFQGNVFQAVAQDGHLELGGDDLDAEIAGKIWDELNRGYAVSGSLIQDAGFLSLLAGEAEKAKRDLVMGKSVGIPVACLFPGDASGDIGGLMEIRPEQIRDSLQRFLSGTGDIVERLLDAADLKRIGGLRTMGGMSVIPKVFRNPYKLPQIQCTDIEADSILTGALLYARTFSDEQWKIRTGRIRAPSTMNEPATPPIPQREADRSYPEKPERARIEASRPPKPESRWADNFIPFLDAAQKHYQQNRLAESIASFEDLLTELGKFCSVLYHRAASSILPEGDRPEERLKMLRLAHQRDPANTTIILDLAVACRTEAERAFSAKQDQRVLELTTIGIESLRSNPVARKQYPALLARLHYIRGCALYRTNAYAGAESEFVRSLELDDQELYRNDLKAIREALQKTQPPVRKGLAIKGQAKTGRNEPCPCGSGKKYKVCCGR